MNVVPANAMQTNSGLRTGSYLFRELFARYVHEGFAAVLPKRRGLKGTIASLALGWPDRTQFLLQGTSQLQVAEPSED
jgi:hypothetical protein